jgi:hypothetical protein
MTMGSPPPGAQAEYERWSLVFFTRPGNPCVLRALVESSPIIAEAVKNQPDRNFETGSTAAEWFARRTKNRRINNRTVRIFNIILRGRDHEHRNATGTRDMGCEPRHRAHSDGGLVCAIRQASFTFLLRCTLYGLSPMPISQFSAC